MSVTPNTWDAIIRRVYEPMIEEYTASSKMRLAKQCHRLEELKNLLIGEYTYVQTGHGEYPGRLSGYMTDCGLRWLKSLHLLGGAVGESRCGNGGMGRNAAEAMAVSTCSG